MSDQNRVSHPRSRSNIRALVTSGFVACLVLAACSGGDETGGPAPEVDLGRRLAEADLGDEVVDCVLQLAGDELRRGPLDPVMEEELVASCERAQEVLNRSDAQLDGSGGADTSGLAFSERTVDDQPVGYGSDPTLDRLWDRCEDGDGVACDRLFEQSPVGSEYEQFGLSCGNRERILDCGELDIDVETP